MIGIIDYGMGNLGSVSNACRFLGLDCSIIEAPAQMDACQSLVLPGVGAFADCMNHLEEHGFINPLREWMASGRPFMGICLGLQVLFESSAESPSISGLGVLEGRVERFEPSGQTKVPQIGWNRVRQTRSDCPLFRNIKDESFFYLVHSFYVLPRNQSVVAGETEYGIPYCSAVWKDNIFATQFHPEKSQQTGLRMLKNFGEWSATLDKKKGAKK